MKDRTVNQITGKILDACIKIHSSLWPGLFETVCEELLAYELDKRGLLIERQKTLPVFYDDIKFEHGFRADITVGKKVIIKIKSVELLHSLHF